MMQDNILHVEDSVRMTHLTVSLQQYSDFQLSSGRSEGEVEEEAALCPSVKNEETMAKYYITLCT